MILELQSVKLQFGESERAAKFLNISDVLSKKLARGYAHFKRNNHVNKTVWEEVQKVRTVEMLLLSDQDDQRVYSIAREAAHVSGKD